MITIQVIALGLSLYDPVLCDTIIPLIDAVVCLSLQRIMLEDVDCELLKSILLSLPLLLISN